MRTRYTAGLMVLLALLWACAPLKAQDSLSVQVLRLLTRINSWTATQTFLDLRLARGVPSTTLNRFYADSAGVLYWNGAAVAGGSGGGVGPHNLLSTTHTDTLTATVTRGAVVVGNSTPAWAKVQPTVTGSMLRFDGTDTGFSLDGSALTSLNAAALSGTAGAFNGAAITALNASALASGTVPLARLSGITTTQLAAGAGIVYSQLTLTGGIVNADVSGSAAIAYAKLSLAGSIVTGDIANGTILFADWAGNACTSGQYPQYDGATWGCATVTPGAGTVTSVALALPAIFTVSGSPVTGSGTLTGTLATQAANLVWASPTTGAAAAPTFRALVNADLPLTGVAAGTYASVTINTRGVVTAASALADLTTQVTGALPRANGGTGVVVSADDSVLIGSGTVWAPQTLPDCTTGFLGYAQATNLFSCGTTGGPTHDILSATHADSLAAAVIRGDLLRGNATPKWSRLAIGASGTALISNGTDPTWGNAVSNWTVDSLLGNSATASTSVLGTTVRGFVSLTLGGQTLHNLTLSTSNWDSTGTSRLVAASYVYPGFVGSDADLIAPLVLRDAFTWTAGAIGAGACTEVSGSPVALAPSSGAMATTAAITASLSSAPQTNWKKGIYLQPYVIANGYGVFLCNPTAGSITPESTTINVVVFVP